MEYKIASQRRCSCVTNCDANPDKLFFIYVNPTPRHYYSINTAYGSSVGAKKVYVYVPYLMYVCGMKNIHLN